MPDVIEEEKIQRLEVISPLIRRRTASLTELSAQDGDAGEAMSASSTALAID